jgi:alkanesulfonate monooxygenase SsuD/methylene tetrahydromethanopterin reductase-like flavin-dependent oxidoreductase (luciferase family)
MPAGLPALNLVAAPGQRRATLDMAREIERRGFAGISVSSQYSNTSQCLGLAFATEQIPFATAIAPIYAATAEEFANSAAYLHEVSGGRFQFGIGVAHDPAHQRMGVTPGRPLADIREFVAKVGSYGGIGELPPIILAALRQRMVALAADIADGVVFANAARSHTAASLGVLPADKRDNPNFFIGNRIRTCVCDDETEAAAVLRRTVTNYALMPNYRNYWKEAGYVDEMTAIENAVADGRPDQIAKYLPDRWLADIALFGPAAKIREGVEAWRDAGIRTPVLVPLSADGDPKTALRDVFAAFAD